MTLRVVFHPKVFSEVDTIMSYYERVSGAALASDFYNEFQTFVGLASREPEIFNPKIGGLRRANLRRFPYNFLFRTLDDHLRVLVVRHHARNPAYGTGRI